MSRWMLAGALGLSLVLGAPPARAEAPRALVQRTVDDVMKVLRDPALQGAKQRKPRLDRIRRIADGIFDWQDMARRCLGVHWRTASEAHRTQFVTLFTQLLSERYTQDFDRFKGEEKVEVKDAVQHGADWEVRTVLVTQGRERIPIAYFMHSDAGRWRIHDFSIEGVSLVNHYRKSFQRFLVNNPMDALLERLKQKQ